MNIVITGSNGQLGREMIRQLSSEEALQVIGQEGFPWTPEEMFVTGVDLDDVDITDLSAITVFLESIKPDIIINCAAFTAVDKCETEQDTAYLANALGPRNLAIAADKLGAKLVHISTDYVFDGEGNSHYNEFSTTNPKTVYGTSKLAGEQMVQQFCKKFFIFRTAWLYGDGNNFVKTMIKLGSERSELRVVDDQHGTPTSTRALTACILEVMQSEAYGIYHATCEGETSWHAFTQEIMKLMKMNTNVIPVSTTEYPRPAPRPKYSVLDNMMLRLNGFVAFPTWQNELTVYIREMR